jgi:hypothetical protein
MVLPSFNPPRRGGAPRRTSAAFQSYATVLANQGNPQEEEGSLTAINRVPPP